MIGPVQFSSTPWITRFPKITADSSPRAIMETQETQSAEDKTKKLGPILSKYLADPKVFDPELLTGPGRLRHLRAVADLAGTRYRGCNFDNYQLTGSSSQRDALAKICDFANATYENYKLGRCGLILMGNPGTGKDHFLIALMFNAIIRWGFNVGRFNGIELYSQMRDRIDDRNAPERTVIHQAVRPNILVLSDPVPPKGEIGQYNSEILYQIIDRRYQEKKPTWVSMNVEGGDDARNKLADNLVDRLRHDSLVIKCDWESYRKPQ